MNTQPQIRSSNFETWVILIKCQNFLIQKCFFSLKSIRIDHLVSIKVMVSFGKKMEEVRLKFMAF